MFSSLTFDETVLSGIVAIMSLYKSLISTELFEGLVLWWAYLSFVLSSVLCLAQ